MSTLRSAGCRCAAATFLVLAGALPAAADGSSVRVASDYFGINFQRIDAVAPSGREGHLDAIRATGVREMRTLMSWSALEPQPVTEGHQYRFDYYDPIVYEAAKRRIRIAPTIVQTPGWATSETGLSGELQCSGAQSRRPTAIAPYAAVAAAIAGRYGRGGSFWGAHPELPHVPFTRFEIWNEPNAPGGWCPEPEPSRYAEMFVMAAAAIRDIDPRALVATGGMGLPARGANGYIAVDRFLGRAVAAQRAFVLRADEVTILIEPRPPAVAQAGKVREFRELVRAGDIPDRVPLVIGEIGWATSGVNGNPPVAEADRARTYSDLTTTLSRTNCNVAAIFPHTWITNEDDPDDVEDWYGIADPATASRYPSASSYSKGIRLMRGKRKREPPRRTIMACPGMRKPDQDGDAVRDERDYHPLHRGRVTKGGRLTVDECSVRMIFLRERMGEARGPKRHRLARAHARLVKRCTETCHNRRLTRLERRALRAAFPAAQRKRRIAHREAVRDCR